VEIENRGLSRGRAAKVARAREHGRTIYNYMCIYLTLHYVT